MQINMKLTYATEHSFSKYTSSISRWRIVAVVFINSASTFEYSKGSPFAFIKVYFPWPCHSIFRGTSCHCCIPPWHSQWFVPAPHTVSSSQYLPAGFGIFPNLLLPSILQYCRYLSSLIFLVPSPHCCLPLTSFPISSINSHIIPSLR